MMKPKLSISFSGGRTSAVMTKLLIEKYKNEREIIVTFANTGQEDERTLDFVKACDDNFNFNTVWLEAIVGPRGVGIRHKVVDYETAERDGKVFENAVAKYGVFNMTSPSCTSRLKTEPMESYLKSQGFIRGKKLNYETAIGIRADEADRASVRADKFKFIYPLIEWGWTKKKISEECSKWPFDLQLPGDHYGNCRWCWKKSDRKLFTLVKEDESIFDFPATLEKKYGHIRANKKNKSHSFFRKKRTARQIVDQAKKTNFEPYRDCQQLTLFSELDSSAGCGESCEVYPSDYTEKEF